MNKNRRKLGSWGASAQLGFCVLLVSLGVLLSTTSAQAAFCEICKLQKSVDFYSVKNKYYKKEFIICKFCRELDEHCDVCRLPVLPKTGLRLPDKRVFCPDHVKIVVVSDEVASATFSRAKDEAMDLLRQYPPLPHLNIRFHMVTREDFIREYRRTPGIEDPYTLLGLTIPRTEQDGTLSFDIYVVHGLTGEAFLSTCAHEYTHTWMISREKPTRQLHPDTREGFCELIAYKVASKVATERELTRILENGYTRGQVNAFIAAEKEHSFYKIVRWLDDGVDTWIDADKLPRVVVLRDGTTDEAPPVALNWTQAKPTQAPEKLILKGLSGAGSRRFALINDATLAANEEGKVRIGSSNLLVRCLTISSNSVTVQVRGENTPRTLLLGL